MPGRELPRQRAPRSSLTTLEFELVERESYVAQSEACLNVFGFIGGWYNPHRLSSAIGDQSPVSCETEHSQGQILMSEHIFITVA